MMETIKELKEYCESLDWSLIYNPVVVDNELIFDGNRRKLKNQHARVNHIVSKIKEGGYTFLDLGCNTGYMLKEFIKQKQVVGTGVDTEEELLKICEMSYKFDNINATFVKENLWHFLHKCRIDKIKFDYVSMTSVFNWDVTMEQMHNLMAVTRRRLFLEPTNHEKLTIAEQKERYENSILKKDYRSNLLAYTDYQDRGLYVVFQKLPSC